MLLGKIVWRHCRCSLPDGCMLSILADWRLLGVWLFLDWWRRHRKGSYRCWRVSFLLWKEWWCNRPLLGRLLHVSECLSMTANFSFSWLKLVPKSKHLSFFSLQNHFCPINPILQTHTWTNFSRICEGDTSVLWNQVIWERWHDSYPLPPRKVHVRVGCTASSSPQICKFCWFFAVVRSWCVNGI